MRFGQPVSRADLRKVILKYLPQAMISSRQATAARLLLPRSQDMALSTSFSMLKLLAEELKATDYTLTQSSLDQVSEFNSTIQRRAFRGLSSILLFKCSAHREAARCIISRVFLESRRHCHILKSTPGLAIPSFLDFRVAARYLNHLG